jgi:hypothetical protein
MAKANAKRQFIEALVKHLPPSASHLRLLDVNGAAGKALAKLDADLEVSVVSNDAGEWTQEANTADAVVAYDHALDADFLTAVQFALRPGGRLIVLDPTGSADESLVKILEDAGYIRILVEDLTPTGVLIRGEKPHLTDDTVERVRQVANRDSAASKGRYLHLLIRQTPNKPVWKLEPDEQVAWEAVALSAEDGPVLLAFISLPKAVNFMQQAVLENKIRDINKVAKFKRETANSWTWPLLLNPDLDAIDAAAITLVTVDPASAEAPDE